MNIYLIFRKSIAWLSIDVFLGGELGWKKLYLNMILQWYKFYLIIKEIRILIIVNQMAYHHQAITKLDQKFEIM